MTNMEKVIKALKLCIADGYCNDCPYEKECFDEKSHMPFGKEMMRDALALLQKQENEIADRAIITDDASIPEQFWSIYDPADDVVACTSCLICGKDIPLRRYESGPRVCSECKKAVAAMKRGDRNAAD